MHEESTECAFIKRRKREGSDGSSVLCKRICRCPLFGIDEIADAVASQKIECRVFGDRSKRFWPLALRVGQEKREELIARTGEPELKLAVLVHRAERLYRRRALAILTEAFCPKLAVPGEETLQPVCIASDDRHGRALLAHHGDLQRGAECGR